MQEVFKKIIEKLETYSDADEAEQYGTIPVIELCRAIEIVKQTAKQYNNGWIPCSEPPKTSDYILLSFSNFSVPMVGRYEENEDGGAYYIGDEDKSCVSQDIFVNAWQPIPQPYQTKGE